MQNRSLLLKKEFLAFLEKATEAKDIFTAFLVWKDQFGKTMVHQDACLLFGRKKESACHCPRRLACGMLDSLVAKLCAIFSQAGRTLGDSVL